MTAREDYVTHALSGLLYETWTPQQVRRLAHVACRAIDEWTAVERLKTVTQTLPARKDHTVVEAHAYRDGIEDVTREIDQWQKFWREDGE